LQPPGNLANCLIPSHRIEPTFTLSADAAKRTLEALRGILAIQVSGHLPAQKASRHGVIRVSAQAHRPALFDGYQDTARIRTVESARGVPDLGHGKRDYSKPPKSISPHIRDPAGH
jgi:hypothetical protein